MPTAIIVNEPTPTPAPPLSVMEEHLIETYGPDYERACDVLAASALNRDCHRVLAEVKELKRTLTRFLADHDDQSGYALLDAAGIDQDGTLAAGYGTPAQDFDDAVRAFAALGWQVEMVLSVVRSSLPKVPEEAAAN